MGEKGLKMSNEQKLEMLKKKPIVEFYINFSRKQKNERTRIIKEYDSYLDESKISEAGQIYKESKAALFNGDFETLRRLSNIARKRLADNDYKKAPQPFDPKFIENQSDVRQYRALLAKITGDIPDDFKENLL